MWTKQISQLYRVMQKLLMQCLGNSILLMWHALRYRCSYYSIHIGWLSRHVPDCNKKMINSYHGNGYALIFLITINNWYGIVGHWAEAPGKIITLSGICCGYKCHLESIGNLYALFVCSLETWWRHVITIISLEIGATSWISINIHVCL